MTEPAISERLSLELSRRRDLSLRQVRPFSELWLYRREDGEEDVEAPGEATGEGESP